MNIRPLVGKTLKWLSWAIIGLLILILLVVLFVHLPPGQKIIAKKASKYLTETVGSDVSITGVRLSILDGIAIVGLDVKDPEGNNILNTDRIAVMPDLIGIIFGDYNIHYLGLEGFRGNLTSSEQGLNIQFILDAFSSAEEDTTAKESKPFSISVDRINFEDFQFNYQSEPDSMDLNLTMNELNVEQTTLSIAPDKILSRSITLDRVALSVLSSTKSESEEKAALPPLDFGIGFDIEIGVIELINNSVSYHFRTLEKTPKFNPDHLDLDSIQLNLADILIREDSLSLDLQQFSANLGGEVNVSLNTEVGLGYHEASISGLLLSMDSSEVNLAMSGKYASWPELMHDFIEMELLMQTQGSVQLSDLAYFLPDSVLLPYRNLPSGTFDLSAQYSDHHVLLEKFMLTLGQSQLAAAGDIGNVDDPDNIHWEHVEIDITSGPEFANMLKPYAKDLQLPEKMQIEISSTGKLALFDIQTHLTSADGNADIGGNLGITDQGINLDGLKVSGQKLALGKILDMPWLGSIDFSMEGNGKAGTNSDLSVAANIEQVTIKEHNIHDVDIRGTYKSDVTDVSINIRDPRYLLELESHLLLGEVMKAESDMVFEEFNLGRLLGMDSTLVITGNVASDIGIGASTMNILVEGSGFLLKNDSINYPIDSIALYADLSGNGSTLYLHSDNLETNLEANFDVRNAPELIAGLFGDPGQPVGQSGQNRNLSFDLDLRADRPLSVFNKNIYQASDLRLKGFLDEQNQAIEVSANTGRFVGFGISFDSLGSMFQLNHDELSADMLVKSIHYDTLNLGDFSVHAISEDSTMIKSTLSLSRDSLFLLKTIARIQPVAEEIKINLDSLVIFNEDLSLDSENPITISGQNVLFDQYSITNDEMEAFINGDLNEFELSLENVDLKKLNPLLSPDSTIIYHGNLNALFAFVKADNKINLQTRVDSLKFKDIPSIDLSARAITENGIIPVTFSLNSATNNILLTGHYNQSNSEIDANLSLELDDLGMFRFFVRDILESASGRVNGNIDVSGTLKSPHYDGKIEFTNVDITTISPRSTFHVEDELLTLNNSGVVLNDFIIMDQQQNPLRLNGSLLTKDYKNFDYDFTIQADNYMLINNPHEEDYQLQGTLVIGSDIKVNGNLKDLEVDAELVIRDTTALTYVMPQQDLELVTNEGIVEFVDPNDPADTLSGSGIKTMYDSVISTLPSFNLNTAIQLEEKALLRVVLDANSGDYIEVLGSANLKYTLDRTKNAELTGEYTISSGFYQLSFYDLVKKKFEISEGSTVKWSGNPNRGELDIKATYTIKTSSVGLIGHEIGENEKELYRRALPYEVGILIGGDLENPVVSFALDLPQDEKINYPALANKLNRLQQPEFESELNKQVFGLLVMGGFIPESGGSAFDEQLIATTALSNSVNAILASQLNRFASQLIKGVDIDVGLQSYSDSGTGGGGQTRTAMDFRVTKRLMDDRLSIEVGGGMDINSDKAGSYAGSDNFRGDIAVIYDLTPSGNKQLKVFNNETYDIIYHEIRNTGVSLIFIREFDKKEEQQEP